MLKWNKYVAFEIVSEVYCVENESLILLQDTNTLHSLSFHFLQSLHKALKKKKCLFPVPRPTLNFWPDPNFFLSISKRKKKNPPRRFNADFLTDISFNI